METKHVVYVDIDDVELNVEYSNNPDVEEGIEGKYTVTITKEAFEQVINKIGFRECPSA